jgi:hypothetical protein
MLQREAATQSRAEQSRTVYIVPASGVLGNCPAGEPRTHASNRCLGQMLVPSRSVQAVARRARHTRDWRQRTPGCPSRACPHQGWAGRRMPITRPAGHPLTCRTASRLRTSRARTCVFGQDERPLACLGHRALPFRTRDMSSWSASATPAISPRARSPMRPFGSLTSPQACVMMARVESGRRARCSALRVGADPSTRRQGL